MVLKRIPVLNFSKLDKEVNIAFFFFFFFLNGIYNCVALVAFKIKEMWIGAQNQYAL